MELNIFDSSVSIMEIVGWRYAVGDIIDLSKVREGRQTLAERFSERLRGGEFDFEVVDMSGKKDLAATKKLVEQMIEFVDSKSNNKEKGNNE